MLVPSHRPTPADLELWADYEDADRLSGASVAKQVRTMNAILEFCVLQPPCYCGVSWGKDSVVVAHLLWTTCRTVPLIHLRPTNHNPDCDAVRDAYFARFPGQPYSEAHVDYSDIPHNLTDAERDKATDERWYAAIRESGAPYGGRRILGIRADESMGRRLRCFRWSENSPSASAPIAFWTVQDVFGYLAYHDLPVHPAYACLGGGRWPRDRIRVAEIGDTHGKGGGRDEWEREYYGDVRRRLEGNSYLAAGGRSGRRA